MKLRSDLSRARGLGSAKAGAHHWWHQRLSAIALVPLGLWFVIALLGQLDASYTDTVQWISSPLVTVLLIALIIGTFYHALLGIQVVIEDYVHGELLKIGLLILMKFALVFGALLGIVAVLKISFGMA